jgi:hypothetical protein
VGRVAFFLIRQWSHLIMTHPPSAGQSVLMFRVPLRPSLCLLLISENENLSKDRPMMTPLSETTLKPFGQSPLPKGGMEDKTPAMPPLGSFSGVRTISLLKSAGPDKAPTRNVPYNLQSRSTIFFYQAEILISYQARKHTYQYEADREPMQRHGGRS